MVRAYTKEGENAMIIDYGNGVVVKCGLDWFLSPYGLTSIVVSAILAFIAVIWNDRGGK